MYDIISIGLEQGIEMINYPILWSADNHSYLVTGQMYRMSLPPVFPASSLVSSIVGCSYGECECEGEGEGYSWNRVARLKVSDLDRQKLYQIQDKA